LGGYDISDSETNGRTGGRGASTTQRRDGEDAASLDDKDYLPPHSDIELGRQGSYKRLAGGDSGAKYTTQAQPTYSVAESHKARLSVERECRSADTSDGKDTVTQTTSSAAMPGNNVPTTEVCKDSTQPSNVGHVTDRDYTDSPVFGSMLKHSASPLHGSTSKASASSSSDSIPAIVEPLPLNGNAQKQAGQQKVKRKSDRVFLDEAEYTEEFKLPVLVAVGFIFLYVLLGAGMYTLWEDWTYLESFYFVFITVSTIGE
jgi:hypothetical protein